MDYDLTGKRIALLATDGFEDRELIEPRDAVIMAGAEVDIISIHEDTIVGKNGQEVEVNYTVKDISADDYDGLLLPGGVENPDVMRQNNTAIEFVRASFHSKKPIAAICHAPWLLIEAGAVEGRLVTSWPSLKTDLVNARASWVDEAVIVDEGIVTSRTPDDIPVFSAKAIEEFAEGKHNRRIMKESYNDTPEETAPDEV